MSDVMTPIPFGNLMDRIMREYEKENACFGLKKAYKADPSKFFEVLGRKLETKIGPAAGPNSQLAQNIVASYYAGSRFFELKTVQKMDGRELAECVKKPCILAEDECYNCEWSTELTVPQAFNEYVKAWFAMKVLAKELGLGAMDGFQYNMSVGYDLEGIKTEKVDTYIESMKNAENTEIFKECKQWLHENIDRFEKFNDEDLEKIDGKVCDSITLSTLHGCPPAEIERIAKYLLTEKHVNTFIKCNPTLLGYETARKILDDMGYDYIAFTDFHFNDDLQYEDAIPMIKRLQEVANEENKYFGVKITNTFPVDVTRNELPSTEMYMSGKSLYPLSLLVAAKLSREFDGKLRISYCGGCDYFNIDKVINTGIWPVTVATTILKPGGYLRLKQMAELLDKEEVKEWTGVDVEAIEKLAVEARTDVHHVKPIKPIPSRKSNEEVPLVDCFTAPCSDRCPIHQDITTYGRLVNEEKYEEALEVILEKNPLPFITGNICVHSCMSACTRTQYESPVQIRENKLIAARNAFDTVIKKISVPASNGKKVAVIGAGPAGISAAYFLAKEGCSVKVYDENEKIGGVISNIIPGFRIPAQEIQNDAALAKAYGAEFIMNTRIDDIKALKEENDAVVITIGAHKEIPLSLENGESVNAHEFLREFNEKDGIIDLGENVVVVGAGNTAMDTARAAKRTKGVKNVYLAYRRTKRYMPADEEELNEAIEDGVEFMELLAPKTVEGKELVCEKMELGAYGKDGRRSVNATGVMQSIPCDTLIASIGEKIEGSFYEKNGIEVTQKGAPVLNKDTNETSLKGVYAAGDGAFGASVVVNAIADTIKACEAILNKEIGEDRKSITTEEAVIAKKGNLEEAPGKGKADARCLTCDAICENCVDVCPNRANVSITVPGREMAQIIHVDYMCNECGNCEAFCPYASAPYRNKFTLYNTEADMDASPNDGFVFVSEDGDVVVRLAGEKMNYKVGEKDSKLFFRLAEIIDTVYREYSYLILK